MQPDVDGIGQGPDETPESSRSVWWAVHRPETYALAGFTLAVVALLQIGPADRLVQTFLLDDRSFSFSRQLGWGAAIYGLLALGGLGLAAAAIRTEDEDSTWSPPVARAALVVGVVALVIAVVAVIGVLVTDTPRIPGFTAPSP